MLVFRPRVRVKDYSYIQHSRKKTPGRQGAKCHKRPIRLCRTMRQRLDAKQPPHIPPPPSQKQPAAALFPATCSTGGPANRRRLYGFCLIFSRTIYILNVYMLSDPHFIKITHNQVYVPVIECSYVQSICMTIPGILQQY